MADFRKRIEVLIDFTTQNASRGLRTLRSDIAAVDGPINKAKVGLTGLGDQLGIGVQQAALAGGAALVAFGAKSVTAFQDAALGAGKFSDATGFAVEDASRWIEIASDVGISAETVQTSFGRFAKQIKDGTSPALEDLGVEAVLAADGTTDLNATVLATIDALNGVRDPAERARLASQLFGRGWQSMAELVTQDADALAASLAGVSDAQVIDEDEVAKAREFRERMDELNDKLQELFLTVGESLVPAVSDLAEGIGILADGAAKLEDINPFKEWVGVTDILGGPVGVLRELGTKWIPLAVDGINSIWRTIEDDAFNDLEIAAAKAALAVGDSGEAADDAVPSIDDLLGVVEDLQDAYEDARAKVEEFYDELRRPIEAEQQLIELNEKIGEMAYNADLSRGSLNELQLQVIDYAEEVGGIPKQQLTEILAAIDDGNLAFVYEALRKLTEPRPVYIQPVMLPATGSATQRSVAGGTTVNGVYIPPGLNFSAPPSPAEPAVEVSGRAASGVTLVVNNNGGGFVDPDALAREMQFRMEGMR